MYRREVHVRVRRQGYKLEHSLANSAGVSCEEGFVAKKKDGTTIYDPSRW